MTEYTPDSWVVIKMTHKNETFYKVLGGWAGGYLDGDSWRLSSVIEKCEYDIDNDRYCFVMQSSSTYVCMPEMYGLRLATLGIWDTMKKQYPDQLELLEDCDWSQYNWTK